MNTVLNKVICFALGCAGISLAQQSPCNEETMDAFAYEDCLAEHNLTVPGAEAKPASDGPRLTVLGAKQPPYSPFHTNNPIS